jgi:hypothetical protein
MSYIKELCVDVSSANRKLGSIISPNFVPGNSGINVAVEVNKNLAALREELKVASNSCFGDTMLLKPIIVAVQSKTCTVFARSNTWIMGSNPT